ncbi:MAG: polysaccharide deacetylase family protein [Anaerolineae bacterium]|nr:polysaccharide deacetylase family protein [Anaerolineae bacterium]
MQEDGFVFGAHTRSHPKLNTLSQTEQAAEIIESCKIICEITGNDQVPFAFPFSGNGVDRDFLAGLRAQHPHIGPIFDTQKLRRDRPFIQTESGLTGLCLVSAQNKI